MKATIRQQDFARAVRLAATASKEDDAIPILKQILVVADGKDKLITAGSDLRVSILCEANAEIIDDGGIIVDAKKAAEVAKSLPAGPLSLSVERDEKGYSLSIKTGRTVMKLPGKSHLDFPKMPNYSEAKYKPVMPGVLKDLIQKVQFAASNSEDRPVFHGGFFTIAGNSMQMVCADGHRMAIAEKAFPDTVAGLENGVIVPFKGMSELVRILADADVAQIAVVGDVLFCKTEQMVLAIKLVDGQYPPFKTLLPASSDKRMVADRMALVSALKRSMLIGGEKRTGAKSRLDLSKGRLTISAQSEIGNVSEPVEVIYDGPDFTIAFNPTYIVDSLIKLEDERVVMEMTTGMSPALIKPEKPETKFTAVVMPMSVDTP